MNSYDLSRAWFDFSFNNPDKVKPIHTAIYFFAIEHCNRLGWKKKFGFPTSMVLEANGIKSYSSYKKHFDEIVDFGFFIVHEYSKNQYSSNVIELTLNVKAHTKAQSKALDKALQKHSTKQSQSTVSIDKQLNNITNKQYNKEQLSKFDFSIFNNDSIVDFWLNWINYKKEQFKDEYKSDSSHQIAINKLCKLSNGDTKTAKEIIENSISNLYKGLFELKQQNNATNNKTTMDERMEQAKRRLNSNDSEPLHGFGGISETFSDFEIVS